MGRLPAPPKNQRRSLPDGYAAWNWGGPSPAPGPQTDLTSQSGHDCPCPSLGSTPCPAQSPWPRGKGGITRHRTGPQTRELQHQLQHQGQPPFPRSRPEAGGPCSSLPPRARRLPLVGLRLAQSFPGVRATNCTPTSRPPGFLQLTVTPPGTHTRVCTHVRTPTSHTHTHIYHVSKRSIDIIKAPLTQERPPPPPPLLAISP